MATWVPIPASGYAEVATIAQGQILPPASNPIYNSAPLWIPAPGAFSLVNTTTGNAL